jgi:streptomycin 6-kinase
MVNLMIPDVVQRRARAGGPAGAAWLAGLPDLVRDLAREWHLTLGSLLGGGTEALVMAVTRADGGAAVLKILPPDDSPAAGELDVLLAADGRGYAAIYAADIARKAVLLEQLGPPLAMSGLGVDRQIALLCATLREAWVPPPAGVPFITGAEKARSLSAFIARAWEELGQPCAAHTIAAALHAAEARARAFDPHQAVLAHGDAHPWNTLQVPDAQPPRFKFVDPDGLIIEPAYDLGILMREWTADLLAGDALERGRARCAHLAALTGLEVEPIWQWGVIERVSTGLVFLQLGLDEGRAMLAVAERWTQE